jgi:phosphatidylglycerol---prolipoprotein diacylglyceryl transferase
MRPIPVAFHIWFIEIHTYGIGLALTFWFGLRYTERRLRNSGYPWQWVTGMFLWVIVAAIVGARALHVLSNLSYYSGHPGQIIAIWQGGLSSFGGLIFAVPVAIVSQRRRCPVLPTLRFADLMAPVLMACWGIGRLLGPQLMIAGGGHPTHQWFGMYYAGQAGRRLPVPIFQSMEDFTIFAVLLLVERWLRSQSPTSMVAPLVTASPASLAGAPSVVTATVETVADQMGASVDLPEADRSGSDGDESASPDVGSPEVESLPPEIDRRGAAPLPPAGIVLGVGMVLWGIERYFDEHLWLGEDGHLGSLLVQWAGGILAVAGIVLLITRFGPLQRWRQGKPDGEGGHETQAGTGDMPDSGHEHGGASEDGSQDVDRSDGPDGSVGSVGPDVATSAPAGSRRALADIDPS